MAKNYNNMYNPENAPEEVKEEVAKVEAEEAPVEEKPKKAKEGKVIGGIQLNVRETPGGNIKTTIADGTKVVIKSSFRNDEWYNITEPVEGYVMKKFIEV